MEPWIAERIEQERQRQREGTRLPLYIEPPAPSRVDDERNHQRTPDERRGWCIIDDAVDTSIDTAI